MNKLFKLIFDRHFRFSILSARGFNSRMSDEKFLKKKFKMCFGYELDLENPKTFNEKLQWLKIHDRKPEYTRMVDKYESKQYVAERIGEQYVIPTYGVWDSFDDIDFDSLPEQFVLKCTHDSGGIVICKEKKKFNKAAAKKKIEKSMRCNYYWSSREWAYKNVRPRIIAEKYMLDEKTAELRDYKFFCFDGEAKMLFIASERFSGEEVKFDFFDMEGNHLPIKNGHPNAKIAPELPQSFEKMKKLAGVLSKGHPHLRVDFYEINGEIYFGELTFFHFGGFVKFEPAEWDKTIGGWIKLP